MHLATRFLITLILWFAGLCAAAQFAKMGLFLPELQQLYPTAEATTGLLITLISLVGAVFGLVAGIFVGKLGAYRALVMGLVIGSGVSLLQAVSQPLYSLLITRILEGISHLAIVIAAPTLIAQYNTPKYRATAMTFWGTFFGVSFAVTAWLALPLVHSHGIRSLFFLHGMITALATLLVVLFVPKTPLAESTERVLPSETAPQPGWQHFLQRHKQAWTSPFIAAPAAGWLFYTFTFVALLALLPSLVDATQRALVSTAMPLASIVASMTLGVVLLWRFTAVQVVLTGFAMAMALVLLLPFLGFSPSLSVALFCALGLVQGASFATIPQLNNTASDQALAYGALAQAGNLGNLIGTPLLLMTVNNGGTVALVVTLASCYALGISVHLIFAKQRARSNG